MLPSLIYIKCCSLPCRLMMAGKLAKTMKIKSDHDHLGERIFTKSGPKFLVQQLFAASLGHVEIASFMGVNCM